MQPTTLSLQRRMTAAALACLALLAASVPLRAVAALASVVLDDIHSSIEYQGTWTRSTGVPRALQGTLSLTSQPGAQARLSFYGKTITLLYSKDVNRGDFQVSIDGQIVESSLSAYSPRTQRQISSTWWLGAQPASHTIVVKLLEPRVTSRVAPLDIDGFMIDLPFAAADTMIDDQSSYIRHAGTWVGQSDISNSSAGTQSVSATEGDIAWLPFRGDQITYHYYGDVNHGDVTVEIDGVSKGTYSLFAANRTPRSLRFAGLGTRPHVIHLTVTGSKEPSATGTAVNVDHFATGATASSLDYFVQEHSSLLYTDDNGGTVPAVTAKFHAVRLDLADPEVRVHPYTANGRNPTSLLPYPGWDPRGDNRKSLLEMYGEASVADKRVMISTDHFCDNDEVDCKGADPGAPEGLFIRDGVLFHANTMPGRAALLFQVGKARIAQPTANERLPMVSNAVGGGPQILYSGQIACDAYKHGPHGLPGRCATSLIEPESMLIRRSGACVADEGRVLYLMATESDSTTTWYNLASFMQSLGCSEGMQFNGGGATGLVVAEAPSIVPSGNRPIGTGLIIARPQQCSAGVCFTGVPVVMPKSRE